MSSFADTGVGSRAWYIRTFKRNADRRGFSWLKDESAADGRQIAFTIFQSAVKELVDSGYLRAIGKPDAPRSTRYEVASIGHRYLEEHKDEIEEVDQQAGLKPPVQPSTLLRKTQTVPDSPPVRSPLVPVPMTNPRSIDAAKRITETPEKVTAEEPDPWPVETVTTPATKPSGQVSLSVAELKRISGQILFERHAAEVTVVDLIKHIEGGEDE